MHWGPGVSLNAKEISSGLKLPSCCLWFRLLFYRELSSKSSTKSSLIELVPTLVALRALDSEL